MILKLLNYRGEEEEVEIGDINDISLITIRIMAGDEVATIRYKDGDMDGYDSDDGSRNIWAPFDGEYDIYNCNLENNPIFDDEWLNREDSYEGYMMA